jgi:hypothetical protein
MAGPYYRCPRQLCDLRTACAGATHWCVMSKFEEWFQAQRPETKVMWAKLGDDVCLTRDGEVYVTALAENGATYGELVEAIDKVE